MNRRTGSVTIRDVAELAGVVPSTVSHVMNNTAPVSAATRLRVCAAIEQLGYRRNTVASSLRQQTTMTIGLLVPTIAEPLYAELVHAISTEAASAGYGIILGHTDNNPQLEQEQLARMLDHRIDGLIVIPGDQRRAQAYQQVSIPLVTINRQVSLTAADPPSIELDNQRAGYLATRHLLSLGHTAIGVISTPATTRYAGYLQALNEVGLAPREALNVTVDSSTTDLIAQGRDAMHQLLTKATITACFVVDDLRALGALEALHDRRLSVPDDIALIGCGDLRVARLARPRLSTVGPLQGDPGVHAMRLLLNLLKNRPTEPRVVLPVELIIRESCGAIMRPLGNRPQPPR